MYLKNEYDEKNGGLLFSVFIGAVIITTFLMQIVVEAIASLRKVSYESIAGTAAASWTMQGILYVVLLVTVFLYHKTQKINFIKANGLDKKFNITDFLMSAVLGAGMLFSFLIITLLYSYFLQEIGYKDNGGFFEINSPGTFIAAILIICVLPAVVEETVFRGAVLNGYYKVFNSVWPVIISALFFMLMHMNPVQVVYPILSGIIMAVLVQRTKTIKVSMTAHFTSNFILVLITYIESFAASDEPVSEIIVLDKETVTGHLIYFAIGIVLLAGAIFYFFLTRRKDNFEAVKENKPAVEDDGIFEGIESEHISAGTSSKDKKIKALLYASFGIIAALTVIILGIFLPG